MVLVTLAGLLLFDVPFEGSLVMLPPAFVERSSCSSGSTYRLPPLPGTTSGLR